MFPDPWFPRWNYQVMQSIFHLIPHTPNADDNIEFLIMNPLLSTWAPAAFFYVYWVKQDEKQEWRRRCLFNTVLAFTIAVLITLIVRPWVAWPAPALNPSFQPLLPPRFWGMGTRNCFPSHSTLTYFVIAAGLWPINRRLSVGLSAFVLLTVSLPRVYVGGHYPIDVLFSCILGIAMLLATWRWRTPQALSHWLMRQNAKLNVRDLLFFFWTFELGEGFRGSEFLLGAARQWMHWH